MASKAQFQILILACFTQTANYYLLDDSQGLVYDNNSKEFYWTCLFISQERVGFL